MTINISEDGTQHINVYSNGATKLGRALSNFTAFEFGAPDAQGEWQKYASVEAYWYDLSMVLEPGERERLCKMSGLSAKREGQRLKKLRATRKVDGFESLILAAIETKVRAQPWLARAMAQNTLPYLHYYVFGGKARDAGHHWITAGITALGERLREEEQGSSDGHPRPAKKSGAKGTPSGAESAGQANSRSPQLERALPFRPQVINVKGLSGGARKGVEYVGREFAGWPGSVLGNPFPVIGKGWNARSEQACAFVAEHGSAEARALARSCTEQRGCVRGQAVELYRHWLKLKLRAEPQGELMSELRRLARLNARELAEKRTLQLGCWCAPAACHADVIADIVSLLTVREQKN